MFAAAANGDLQTMRRPDDPPWATPLAWATRRGHEEVVRLLAAKCQRDCPASSSSASPVSRYTVQVSCGLAPRLR